MPTASQTRTIAKPAGELWELVCDPHHLPRWWPRVERVEGVEKSAFTELLRSSSGKLVRADFEIVTQDERGMRLVWSQRVDGTPFAAMLAAAETEVRLHPRMGMNASTGTDVTVTLVQTLHGWFRGGRPLTSGGGGPSGGIWSSSIARLGHPMISRAAAKTVKEALDGLERICG